MSVVREECLEAEPMDEDLALKIIDDLLQKGASHVQVRMGRHASEFLTIEKGESRTLRTSTREGIGIRVLVENAWGFAASFNLDKKNIATTIKLAFQAAKASAALQRKEKFKQLTIETHEDKYTLPIKTPTINQPPEEKQDYLLMLDDKIREGSKKIIFSKVSLYAQWNDVYFFSSEGAKIEQHLGHTGMVLLALAKSTGGELQARSLQNHESVGWSEFIERNQPEKMAEIASKEATLLAEKAKKCPKGEFSLILDPFQLGLTIHESCAHASELDRVLGYEADFAGTSFLTPEKLNSFKYGNELVTIVNDPSMSHVLGHYMYDDEGTKAKKYRIIDQGIFVNYETDVEFSSMMGFSQSNGNSKAESVHHVPIIRIANVYMTPQKDGYVDVDELIADTREGIYALHGKSHNIDDMRLNFQFNTQIGYFIKNGEIQHPLKNVTYQGYTPRFWNAVDGLTRQYQIYGLPYCGKGNPVQAGLASHGGPWVRFNKIKIGITN